jgi:hypothetical protein
MVEERAVAADQGFMIFKFKFSSGLKNCMDVSWIKAYSIASSLR